MSIKGRIRRLEDRRDLFDLNEPVEFSGWSGTRRQLHEQLAWIGKFGRRINETDDAYLERMALVGMPRTELAEIAREL
ncbi:MAG: hypothetical protein AAFZ99_06580 [Pseudomonadota bacterium]